MLLILLVYRSPGMSGRQPVYKGGGVYGRDCIAGEKEKISLQLSFFGKILSIIRINTSP